MSECATKSEQVRTRKLGRIIIETLKVDDSGFKFWFAMPNQPEHKTVGDAESYVRGLVEAGTLEEAAKCRIIRVCRTLVTTVKSRVVLKEV